MTGGWNIVIYFFVIGTVFAFGELFFDSRTGGGSDIAENRVTTSYEAEIAAGWGTILWGGLLSALGGPDALVPAKIAEREFSNRENG